MAALLTLCGGSLLLALGRFGGVYAFVSSLPGLTSFRAPARHIALFHLALSAVVALVIDDVVTIARTRQLVAWRRLWLLALPAALSVATAAAAHVLRGSAWAASHEHRIRIGHGPRGMGPRWWVLSRSWPPGARPRQGGGESRRC